MERRKWTREQLIVAFNLYCKIPFGKIHNRNPDIISLARVLGRTPSALSWKLANFARFDPALKKRDIKGATHGAHLEREVWDEFSRDWEMLSFESERLRAQMFGTAEEMETEPVFPDGRTRESLVKVRVNQAFFRSAVLAAYESRCCITGLAVPELLCASHIVPWSVDHHNRTNPQNGLCLNALHDRAFDRGLITVAADLTVKLSPAIERTKGTAVESLLKRYSGAKIDLPRRFQPNPTFLQFHAANIYIDR